MTTASRARRKLFAVLWQALTEERSVRLFLFIVLNWSWLLRIAASARTRAPMKRSPFVYQLR